MPSPKRFCEVCGNTVSNMTTHVLTPKHCRRLGTGPVIDKKEHKREYIKQYRRDHRLTAKQLADYRAFKATQEA